MGFQSKHTYCSKTFTAGPSKIGNMVCQMENQLNPGKTKVIIFSRSILARKELNLKLYGETLKIYPQVKFLGITFDSQLTFKKHFEDGLDRCNTSYHRLSLSANKKWVANEVCHFYIVLRKLYTKYDLNRTQDKRQSIQQFCLIEKLWSFYILWW